MLNWQRLHKWLALLVGLQLTLWLVTGLLFNLLDAEYLDGNRYRERSMAATTEPPAPVAALLGRYGTTNLTSVRLGQLLGRPVYHLIRQDGATHFWADSLEEIELTPTQILEIARNSYSGPGALSTPQAQAASFSRFGGSGQVYLINAGDELHTRIYIDGKSGAVLGHLNSGSDLKDWLFMLHFMDYETEDGLSFNHLLVRLVALLALLLGISGTVMLGYRIKQGQLRLPGLNRRPGQITLYCPELSQLETLATGPGSLLDSLNSPAPRLRTSCGGGGRCGLCKVRFMTKAPKANACDLDRLSPSELADGIRLSCQHSSSAAADIALCTKAQLKHWQKYLAEHAQDRHKEVLERELTG
jgi:ferredoxin